MQIFGLGFGCVILLLAWTLCRIGAPVHADMRHPEAKAQSSYFSGNRIHENERLMFRFEVQAEKAVASGAFIDETNLSGSVSEAGAFPDISVLSVSLPTLAMGFSVEKDPLETAASKSILIRLSSACHVKLVLYDAFGQQIAVLMDEERSSGAHRLRLGQDIWKKGVYFFRIQAGGSARMGRLVWVSPGPVGTADEPLL